MMRRLVVPSTLSLALFSSGCPQPSPAPSTPSCDDAGMPPPGELNIECRTADGCTRSFDPDTHALASVSCPARGMCTNHALADGGAAYVPCPAGQNCSNDFGPDGVPTDYYCIDGDGTMSCGNNGTRYLADGGTLGNSFC